MELEAQSGNSNASVVTVKSSGRRTPAGPSPTSNIHQLTTKDYGFTDPENVSHCFGSPDVNPRWNHCIRCADEPWVNVSVFT